MSTILRDVHWVRQVHSPLILYLARLRREHTLHGPYSVTLHLRCDVAVHVSGDGDSCVAEHLRDNFQRYTSLEKEAGAAVAQIMKATAWYARSRD